MRDVAIIGAGELGGALAHVLARRDVAGMVRLLDETGQVAAGKALDIAQAAPVESFATRVTGSADLTDAAGAAVVVLADRAGGTEWQGDDGLMLLRRLRRSLGDAVIVCAGASQRELVERGARELGLRRHRIFGSAPDALVAATRAIVALEAGGSPRDVALTVLGVPPSHLVIPWDDVSVGGFSATRVLDEPARRRIGARLPALWPPGAYALANAAAGVVDGVIAGSRRGAVCFVAPDDRAGVRMRTAAFPVRLGPAGIAEVIAPRLNPHDRVALENAMLL